MGKKSRIYDSSYIRDFCDALRLFLLGRGVIVNLEAIAGFFLDCSISSILNRVPKIFQTRLDVIRLHKLIKLFGDFIVLQDQGGVADTILHGNLQMGQDHLHDCIGGASMTAIEQEQQLPL